MSHDHDHRQLDQTEGNDRGESRALVVALAITGVFLIVELVGGVLFGSLALGADAAHMFSDFIALVVALVAQNIAARPASTRHTFGWQRAEVLAAQFNALLLLAVSAWIAIVATRRFSTPSDVNITGVIVVAVFGLAANLVVAVVLHRSHQHNINVRAATLHTLSDAGGSLAVLVAGIAMALGAPREADAIASLLITLLVVTAAGKLIVDTTHVLLEAVPRHLDVREIEHALVSEASVVRVHHLHVWALAPGSISLSAHVELEGIEALHDAQAEGERLKRLLAERFGVEHATLELECHPCSPDSPRDGEFVR